MAYMVNDIDWGGGLAGEVFAEGYFNLDHAVGADEVGSGYAAPNGETDMQLVFYFSYIIYRDGDKTIFPGRHDELFTVTPPELDYTSASTKAQAAPMIWRFQTDLLKRGKRIYRDGRCDPARGKVSSISRTPYTILMYNFYYEHTVRIAYGRTDWQDYLLADPLLPKEVRFELQVRKIPYTYM